MKNNNYNDKKNKSATNNQWPSAPIESLSSDVTKKKPKTATDNQWTSTNKNDFTQQ